MKKNGFISTSLMFSFFIIFLSLALIILASYAIHHSLLNGLNGNILKDLNENVISKKYTVLQNSIIDGDLASVRNNNFNSTLWMSTTHYNVEPKFDSNNQSAYMRMYFYKTDVSVDGSARFSQRIDSSKTLKVANNRKIYVRYNVFRNEEVNCDHGYGQVVLKIGNQNNIMDTTLCGKYSNWTIVSDILTTNVTSNSQELIFEISKASNVSTTDLSVNINNIMVIDITSMYKSSSTSDDEVKAYLDLNLPYIDENYPIIKM